MSDSAAPPARPPSAAAEPPGIAEHDLRPRWVRVVDAITAAVKPVFLGASVVVGVALYVTVALIGAFCVTLIAALSVLQLVPAAWYWIATEAWFVVSLGALLASPKTVSRILSAWG